MNISGSKEPRALSVDFQDDELIVELEDGRSLHVPLEWFPRLRDATKKQRKNWRLIGRGVGINWSEIDEDISVRALLLPDAVRPPSELHVSSER